MGSDWVLIFTDSGDVVLYNGCENRREAYHEAIAFIIKDMRCALPDRGRVYPKPSLDEIRQAVQYFKESCEIRQVTCYL
jgi:hypothetical protein